MFKGGHKHYQRTFFGDLVFAIRSALLHYSRISRQVSLAVEDAVQHTHLSVLGICDLCVYDLDALGGLRLKLRSA